jgi:hypothetical protein
VKLLIDPDLHASAPGTPGRPDALIGRHGAIIRVYGYFSADPHAGPRCGRCNGLLHVHLWQLVDGGVIDCGRQP